MLKLIVAVMLALACGPALSANLVPSLTFDGYGVIRFGLTIAEAERSLQGVAHVDNSQPDPQACHYAAFVTYPHARFMVENRVITRTDLDGSARNVLGLAVGSKLADVRRRFPAVRITAHKYDDAGHYLVFASPSKKLEIIAEESNGLVTMIRGGLLPSVEYVEGCL